MTKKTRVINRVMFWQKKMGLLNWDILIVFEDFPYAKETDELKAIAKIVPQTSYKMAKLYIPPRYLTLIDDNTIVHELLHCIIADLTNCTFCGKCDPKTKLMRSHFEEQAVSELERMLMRFYQRKKVVK